MLPPAVAVFLVFALLFGLLWLAQRKGWTVFSVRLAGGGVPRTAKQMRVVERLPLTGQHSLHLVACGGRLLVIAVSPGGCHTVAEYSDCATEALSAAGGIR